MIITTKKQQKALVKAISDYLYNGLENGTSSFVEWVLDNADETLTDICENDTNLILGIDFHAEKLQDIICEE